MWIQSKIGYETLVDGEPKQVTEAYLHQAVTFADAENQCYEQLKSRITDMEVKALTALKIGWSDVLFHPFQQGDSFWKVKTKYQTETLTGKAKTVYETFIVPALNDREASERVRENVARSLVTREIINVDVTPVQAVYMPHNQIWEGDWANRMDDLTAQGKKSSHSNQTSLFETPRGESTPVDAEADDEAESAYSIEATDTGMTVKVARKPKARPAKRRKGWSAPVA